MFYSLSFLFAIGFVVIHLSSKYMKFLSVIPRSRLLSAAGGVSVAYVFVHLLPELNHHDEVLDQVWESNYFYFENRIYLVAMIGLAIFYGLENMVKKSQKANNIDYATRGVFWIHIFAFFLYNALIGYLLVDGVFENDTRMLFYFIALAVHFISNDHGLRQTHTEIYDRLGRWLLAASVLVGWILGQSIDVNEAAIAILFSLLAGGVILNVMKEELPGERESTFWAFAAGLSAYTLLLSFA